MRDAIVRRPKQIARGVVERLLELSIERRRTDDKTWPATKIAQRTLFLEYRKRVVAGEPLPKASETGFRLFFQFDEDGVILFLLGVAGGSTRRFVDLGAGDGVYASNCANLALNLGFDGLFVEADAAKAEHARSFYARHPDTRERPPVVINAFITRETLDDLVRGGLRRGGRPALDRCRRQRLLVVGGARFRHPPLRRHRGPHRARARGLRDAV